MNQIRVLSLSLLFVATTGCSRARTLEKQGGYVIAYQSEVPSEGREPAVVSALSRRLRRMGFRYANVKSESDGTFLIELPGANASDVERAQELISGTGYLEFRVLARRGTDDETIARALADEGVSDTEWRWVKMDRNKVQASADNVIRETGAGETQVLVLLEPYNVTGADVSLVYATYDEHRQPCLSATLTKDGAARMKKLTSRNLKRQLGVVFQRTLFTAPVLQSPIGESLQLTGNFTQDEIDFMVAVLKSGSLPIPLSTEPVDIKRVDPLR
jgi:preprotein translocase subunit SecD